MVCYWQCNAASDYYLSCYPKLPYLITVVEIFKSGKIVVKTTNYSREFFQRPGEKAEENAEKGEGSRAAEQPARDHGLTAYHVVVGRSTHHSDKSSLHHFPTIFPSKMVVNTMNSVYNYNTKLTTWCSLNIVCFVQRF